MDAFATTTAETSDYLANEVIARLPPDLTDFLARISVLDEFDADLCEAVTGETRARSFLERIVANDLFVYRLELAGERYRFHQMFAAYLRTVLKSKGDAAYKHAHHRAGDAMYARGDRLGALRHAMAIADVQRAAAIVTDSIATILEVDDARHAMLPISSWRSWTTLRYSSQPASHFVAAEEAVETLESPAERPTVGRSSPPAPSR